MTGNASSIAKDRLAMALLAIAAMVFAYTVWRSLFLIDDAFISFRYARHWAEGHGLLYNIGNPAPVEGYSNFSWVALLALGARIGVPLETFAHVLSISSAFGTLLLVYRFLRKRLEVDCLSSSLAVLALAALPSFHVWASGGLETSFFGLLLFACWYGQSGPLSRNQALALGLLGGALILTRPEGWVWVGGLCLAGWRARGKEAQRPLFAFGALAVAIGVLHLFWRHSYYGEWLPNTVHAKSTLSSATLERGMRTLASWVISFAWPILVLLSPLFATEGKQRRIANSAMTMVAGGLAYNLAVGGDWMPFFRFMAPISAFFAVGLALMLSRFSRKISTTAGLACAAIAILPSFDTALTPRALREAVYFRSFQGGYQSEWQRWTRGKSNTERYTWIGQGIKQHFAPDTTWTGGAIGAIGYYSNIQILGRNGLVHRGVARRPATTTGGMAGHEKRVPRVYFKDQSPTFYAAQIFTLAVPPKGPVFDQAVARVHKRFLQDPLEEGLRGCTYVEARPLTGIPGLVEPATLLLLMHTGDPQRADLFWSRYGQ